MKTSPRRSNKAPLNKPRERPDSGDAFFPDPGDGPARTKEPLAQELAEEYLETATSGEETGTELRDAAMDEEEGGPFVVSPASREFAEDTDSSNPRDAEPEPLPSPMRGIR
jgi:hypothetical protein